MGAAIRADDGISADKKEIRLNNGMKASIGATKSLQAEAGLKLGMTLDVAGKEVKPYLSAAVSHDFRITTKSVSMTPMTSGTISPGRPGNTGWVSMLN